MNKLMKQAREATMPFGKHEGLPLDALPTTYLIWALSIFYNKTNGSVMKGHLIVLLMERLQSDLKALHGEPE